MIFDGNGLTYSDLKAMDMAEYHECIAAKGLFIAALEAKRKEQKEQNEK